MRRAALVAVAVATTLAVAGALGVIWWTLPPAQSQEDLAAAAATVPADADGLVVLAAPRRTARWLAGHVQAVGLLLLADPAGRTAAPRLERAFRAMAASADGPLRIFWRGADLAVAAEVAAGARRAVEALAASEGLAIAAAGATVTVATASAMLSNAAGSRPSVTSGARSAALVRIGARWWWAEATRHDLTVSTGAPAAPPAVEGPSRLATDRLAAITAPAASLGALTPEHAHLVARDGEGWGLLLTGVRLSPLVRRLLGGGAEEDRLGTGPERWHGLLGEVWFDNSGDLALATTPALLAGLRAPDLVPETGMMRGADAAYLLERIARLADDIPGFSRTARDLRAAAAQVAPLRAARWRIAAAGGIIVLEW